jgi:chromosome segregation ATPase
MHEDVEQ